RGATRRSGKRSDWRQNLEARLLTSSLVAIGSRGNGFNKQIFDADEQVPGRGQSDKEGFGPTVSPQLVQSGKGRIASDPALFNLPRPLMVGAFSVHGGEQIFGAE